MARPKSDKKQPDESAGRKTPSALVCSKPEHLLRPDTVAFVGNLVRPWLEQHKLSPYELLCRKDLATEFRNNATVFNSAVRAAAGLQADPMGADTAVRQRELEAYLLDYLNGLGGTNAALLEGDQDGEGASYSALIEAEGEGPARRRLIGAVAAFLRDSPSYGTKVERLLALLEQCRNDDVRAVLDEFFASFIKLDAARNDTFIDEDNAFSLLQDFVGLISAQAMPRRGSCRVVQRLNYIMSRFNLVHMREAFQWAFEHIITNSRTFPSPGKLQGHDHVTWELVELSKLYKKMQVAGGWFANAALMEAMENQVARRTGALQLDAMVADHAGVFNKTLELIKLYPLVFGHRNVARIERRIYETITRHDLSRLLEQFARSPMDQLAQYGILEQKIRKANMGPRVTDEMVDYLARLQEAFIRDRQVFHKFRALRTATEEKGLYTLELLILGAFTAGRCRRAAIKLMLLFLPSKQRLMEAITETKGIEIAEDRTEELCAMYDYFVASM
ncbi:MAG: hypothetical protein EP335_05170 [Alphaproteobacteria bacterium]|nr:MAG: hypothetical protein EP335_05170 [Alphaproteobacteria bacterium]